MAILQYKPNSIDTAYEAMSKTIWKMAHKWARNHKQDVDDLHQMGVIGLMNAYRTYDPNAGRAFSSHAYQWIAAEIAYVAKKDWHYKNNTGFKPIEDEAESASYSLPLDDLIDADKIVDKMSPTAKAIHVARQSGYTYAAIAEQLTNLGKPMTLHQCRNLHLKALEA